VLVLESYSQIHVIKKRKILEEKVLQAAVVAAVRMLKTFGWNVTMKYFVFYGCVN
jgi:hypothetical protein